MKRLLVVLTIVLMIAAGVSAWWWVKGSLPMLDGQVTVTGLHSPVEILIDAHGVPAVYANDESDAWFAAGVLHARDRRWQMELYRRVTMGRLSEVLGASTVPIDQRFLTLGLRDAAKAEWERAARGRLWRLATFGFVLTADSQPSSRPPHPPFDLRKTVLTQGIGGRYFGRSPEHGSSGPANAHTAATESHAIFRSSSNAPEGLSGQAHRAMRAARECGRLRGKSRPRANLVG